MFKKKNKVTNPTQPKKKKKLVCCRMSNKKVVSTDEHEVTQLRDWAGLNPEILALMFVKIDPADEMVRSVACVCKSWKEVVDGPYCWSKVDVQKWYDRRYYYAVRRVDFVVKKLVRRSKWSVQLLSTYGLGDSAFPYVARCGQFLRELKIPRSIITDEMVSKHIKHFPNLTLLDISQCKEITSKGISLFGNQCPSLVHLKRNRHAFMPIGNLLPDDSEAIAIANTMPHLQHIELCFGSFGNSGVYEILHKCKSLAHLDIQKCWHVNEWDGDLVEMYQRLQHFRGPWYMMSN